MFAFSDVKAIDVIALYIDQEDDTPGKICLKSIPPFQSAMILSKVFTNV